VTRNRSAHGLIALPFAFALLGLLLQAQTPAPAARPTALAVLASAPPASLGLSAERLARMRRAIQGYVDRAELAGAVMLVARDGRLAELSAVGQQDRERRVPMRTDALFRIASQTKAITSVAVLLLYEEGRFLLTDPISRFLPEFKGPKVLVPGKDGTAPQLVAAEREISIRDLLTHRSGITYGFADNGPVGDAYRKERVTDGLSSPEVSLADNMTRLSRAPLVSQPGREYHYGLNTDVLGRLVEVVSGQPLDVFVRERLFGPLGMDDTAFVVPDAKWPRLGVVYTDAEGGGLRPMKDPESFDLVVMSPWDYYRPSKKYLSGGAGLVSTAADYARFLEMLRRGGELGGSRLLSPKTVELMTASHTHDIPSVEPVGPGKEFGLGVDVVVDLGASEILGSPGAYGWGGIYGSTYWVDPKERLVAVLMTQRYPGDSRWTNVFRTMVYQALVR
jgi:CubicO group peptidase (beta-lactamase class C family)